MRGAVLVALLLCCTLASANLIGVSYSDVAPNAIVSLDPSSGSITQSLGFNSQWLYAITSTIDINSETYYLFAMNYSGAYSYSVSLSSFSSYSTLPLSQPQIYCAEFDPVSKNIFALSQNDSLIVQLVRLNTASGEMTILYSFPDGWMVPYYTSALINSVYVAVFNSPTGQMMITYNTTSGAIRSFTLGYAGIISLATDGTSGSVLALRLQGLSASLTRQSLISSAYTTVAALPSSVTTFQYSSAVSAGVFYCVVRPASSLAPLLLSVNLSTSLIATQPLPNNTYMAFMQSTTL